MFNFFKKSTESNELSSFLDILDILTEHGITVTSKIKRDVIAPEITQYDIYCTVKERPMSIHMRYSPAESSYTGHFTLNSKIVDFSSNAHLNICLRSTLKPTAQMSIND